MADKEFEYESDSDKSSSDSPSTPPSNNLHEREIQSPETTPTLADLMNPYKYYLKYVHVKKDMAELPLGMQTRLLAPGVVQVIDLKEGGIADQYGVEVESFLLAVNGRQATGEREDTRPNQNGVRMVFAKKRPLQLNQQQPLTYLGRCKRQTGCEYAIVRLNMTTFRNSDLNLVTAKNGKVGVGVNANRTAIDELGLRVGDNIIGVNDIPVRDKHHCEFLLRSGQDLVDAIIERSASSVPTSTAKAPEIQELCFSDADDEKDGGKKSIACYGWDDDEEDDPFGPTSTLYTPPSDPAAGVPKEVPVDVARFCQINARDLARKIVTGKKSTRSKKATIVKTPKSKRSKSRAKIDKAVGSTKLKKPPPPPSKK